MDAQSWLIVAIIGFSLGAVALAAAIILFVKLNIPAILGDLTGRTLAREMRVIRAANTAGDGGRTPSGKMEPQREKTGWQSVPVMDRSAIAAAHASRRLDRLNNGRVTASKAAITETLGQEGATEVLPDPCPETEEPQQQGTTVLEMPEEHELPKSGPVPFRVTRAVIVTHTDEEI